ncbi:MAG: hypothetical protein LRY54_03755 [Alphaproteobacteria bacterium]|nr:hypothetical protein [Alphaproteobacteria bacterium]
MADPAAAATDAAKAAGNKAVGFLKTIATQAFHPKNWIRNAGIVALSAVFLPAAATAATTGGTTMAFLGAAKTQALSLGGQAISHVPGAFDFISGQAGALSEMAKGAAANLGTPSP